MKRKNEKLVNDSESAISMCIKPEKSTRIRLDKGALNKRYTADNLDRVGVITEKVLYQRN